MLCLEGRFEWRPFFSPSLAGLLLYLLFLVLLSSASFARCGPAKEKWSIQEEIESDLRTPFVVRSRTGEGGKGHEEAWEQHTVAEAQQTVDGIASSAELFAFLRGTPNTRVVVQGGQGGTMAGASRCSVRNPKMSRT